MDSAYGASFTASTTPSGATDPPPAARRVASGPGGPPRIRRRNRLITSCLECRRRKLKCDKNHPCGNCTKFVRDCVFLAPALDPAAQLKLAEIKEKMGSLERTLEEDVAKRKSASSSFAHKEGGLLFASLESGDSSDEGDQDAEDERDLEPTPLAVEDAAYYEDADDDVFMDVGIKIGKMRLTERMGGFVRPKIHQEVHSPSSNGSFCEGALTMAPDAMGHGTQPEFPRYPRCLHDDRGAKRPISRKSRVAGQRLHRSVFELLLRS